MKWATRANIHIDRAACAWLIRREVDPSAEFVFVGDPADETILRKYDLTDPVLWRIAAIIHEADLFDERYTAPEAPGFDVALRGLSMVCTDEEILIHSRPLFDGLYEYFRHAAVLGRDPA